MFILASFSRIVSYAKVDKIIKRTINKYRIDLINILISVVVLQRSTWTFFGLFLAYLFYLALKAAVAGVIFFLVSGFLAFSLIISSNFYLQLMG